ncbi:MAG TPA: DUF2007 domain-containing protein [Thermoanaerobaculia bacterium]
MGEAQVAASALDAAGIDTNLVDQNIVGIDWGMSQAVGGVKVMVRDDDLERAREIVTGVATEGEIEPIVPSEDDEDLPVVCPECGSPNFQPVPRFRIFLLIAAIFLGIGVAVGQQLLAITALVAVAIGALLMPSTRCSVCAHRWTPPTPPPRRVDAPPPDARDMIEEKCPRCGSLDVYQIDDRRLKAIPLLFSPSILVIAPMWLMGPKRRCESCGLKLH